MVDRLIDLFIYCLIVIFNLAFTPILTLFLTHFSLFFCCTQYIIYFQEKVRKSKVIILRAFYYFLVKLVRFILFFNMVENNYWIFLYYIFTIYRLMSEYLTCLYSSKIRFRSIITFLINQLIVASIYYCLFISF